MSSTLQTEKTKYDAKALGNDMGAHASNAAQKVKDGVHKAGVALGVSEPTVGEKIGDATEKTVDTLAGNR